MKEVENHTAEVRNHIIRTLLYYDIFNYPLKSEEVFRFLGINHVDHPFIVSQLNSLSEEKFIYRFGEFFTVQNNETNVIRRQKGNAEAERCLSIAQRQARLINRFPFVRAVMASGSLSKGYMDEKSDLDFFIVTHPGRLWIARMLLVMYKRIFLFNSHKYFCVNYFVDTEHLEIEEKNMFTATELATVIPLQGAEYYTKLHSQNPWLKNFFPNYISRPIDNVPPASSGWVKSFCEKLITALGGAWLDKYFMNMTLGRWQKIYGGKYAQPDFQVAFKSKSYASKNHPKHYQRKVTDIYQQKVDEFTQKMNKTAAA